jgi:hypothetical protein
VHWQKQLSARRRRRRKEEEDHFSPENRLKFKEETNSVTFGAQLCVVLKRGNFGKYLPKNYLFL